MIDGFGENALVVGRVVAASAPRRALRGPDVDDADLLHELRPLVYLAPGRFGVVRDNARLPVPGPISGGRREHGVLAAARGMAGLPASRRSKRC